MKITVCEPTRVSELKDGLIHTYDVTPEQLMAEGRIDGLVGGGRLRQR